MPMSVKEQQIHDRSIVWLWEKTFKDGYGTLKRVLQWGMISRVAASIHTCNKFLKFLTAIFFISEELDENKCIESLPKAGISW